MDKVAKFLIAIFILIAVVGSFAGFHYYKVDQAKQEMQVAQADLDKQFASRWQKVIDSYDLLSKNCGSKASYKEFCYSHYKVIKGLGQFEVDPKYAKDFQPQVEAFGYKVIDPATTLFNLMSNPIVGDPDQLKDIVTKAGDLETIMMQYWNNHRELTPVPQKTKDLKPLLAKIYTPKPAAPKVVVVYAYPNWVRTDVQRQAFSSMRDIASRYSIARKTLNRQLNWSYGSSNPAYFANSDVRAILYSAIELRKGLFAEVQETKSVEGMSDLCRQLETMLKNSYQGLVALYDNQDYSTFHTLSSQNDAISKYVRQTFGIR